jgi:uncharacterized protein
MSNITAMWLPQQWPGAEQAEVQVSPGRIWLQGVALAAHGGMPYRSEYAITCGPDWQVRSFALTVRLMGSSARLTGRRDAEGRWTGEDGQELPELAGCTDIDIRITTLTNTLPIRRLGLTEGESAEVNVVYIGVPELTMEPMRQRYTHLGGGRYRYENLALDFAADLTVDEYGLVVNYPTAFTRV